ncbi:MAG TPA: amidase family protein [Sedimentibacter sp.]|nr:amidase family protein [Sedimentibacter sp.]
MENLNILQIQQLIDEDKLSSVQLTEYYINRIKKYDDKYNAVFELNKDAVILAKELDEKRKVRGRRSLLHGIPVLIKDNINVDLNKKLHTTAGAIVLKDLYPNYDAFIVKKLKDAGAVILGKTNLSEFANFIADDSPNGFSALGGQVVNPYGNFDVGGSSSGSAVAAALSFCQIAIGTETSGSIISPASKNSVVGVKPTVGLVSRYGIIPLSWTQDIAGPITRNVIDSTIALNIISGKDINDKTTYALNGREVPNYLELLQKDSLKGISIGIPKSNFNDEDEETVDVFNEAIKDLEKLGAKIVEVNIHEEKHDINCDVLYYEFPKALKDYFKTLGNLAPVNTLKEIVEFNNENLKERVPYDQKVFERCIELEKDFDEKYELALINSINYGKEIDATMNDNNVDLLLFIDWKGSDIAARVGYPSVTVPAGYTQNNMPVGITFTSLSFTEDKLLSYAYAYESAYNKRKNP